MNIAGIIGLAILVLCAVLGMHAGLVRKLTGILSLILSTVLVWAFLPVITDLVRTRTPLYEMVREQCETVIEAQTASLAADAAGIDGSGVLDRESIRSLLEQYGMDSSAVDWMSDAELQGLIDQYFPGYTLGESVGSGVLSSLTKVEQTKLIRSLPIPGFLQDMLLGYNNSEGYKKLNVTDFGGYIAGFFANLIVQAAAFLVTLLVVNLVLRAIFAALDLFASLPVISAVNRAGGLAIGLVEGVCVIWILLLLVSLFSATPYGTQAARMVSESAFLSALADWNIFYKLAAGTLSGIL